MSSKLLSAALSGLIVTMLHASATAQTAGVSYTVGQADRGEGAYASGCAGCHGANLEGGGEPPPLSGRIFASNYLAAGKSPATLYSVIRYGMPAQAPGSLSTQTYADIVAFILEHNGVAAGPTELPPDEAALAEMTFTAPE